MTDPTINAVIRGRRGITGPIGEPVQNPLGDLEMSPETALYVGTLEAQLAAYATNEVKYRVLLELITGESWYSTRVDVDVSLLADIATEALVKRGMDGTEARVLVNKRLSFGVEEETESVPVQPIPEHVNESPEMSVRFKNWRRRREDEGALPRRPPTTEPIAPEEISPEETKGGDTQEDSEPA